MKISKGMQGYIKKQRGRRIVFTLLGFLSSAGIYLAGLALNHGDVKNIYTIIAVVGVIPSSMSFVSMVMFWIHTAPDDKFYQETTPLQKRYTVCNELIVTTKEDSLLVWMLIICQNQIAGFAKADEKKLRRYEAHLCSCLESVDPDVTVKLFSEQEHWMHYVGKFSDGDPESEDALRQVLLSVSL